MKVPFLDLAREHVALLPELMAAVERVFRSGHVLYGSELEAFETELAAWFGVKHAVGVASGTDAVEMALRACGHGDGDRVQCPAFTAVPCVNAIEAAGCVPELSDVLETGHALYESDDHALVVSMFGQAAPAKGSRFVEDIAHAMGARDRVGNLAGTRGICGAVSFYPTKILGAVGDGGAVITNNDDIAARIRSMRHYGFDVADVSMRGQNSRLCEIQAAILRVKLPHVENWIGRRNEIARRYSQELNGAVGHVQPFVAIERQASGARNAYHVYVVHHGERDRIVAALKERGIGTMIHYPKAIHQHSRWKSLGYDGQFPVAEQLAREVLSLPCYPFLRDDEQDAVIAAVKDVT